MWKIQFTPVALEELEKIKSIGLSDKVKELLKIIEQNPYTPPCEKLLGNLKGCYSRRINLKHRLVYRLLGFGRIMAIKFPPKLADFQANWLCPKLN